MVMDASEVRDRYAEQLSWPNGRLLAWAASVVGVPKVAPADSFVLHAPLELLARAALLPRVGPGSRALARERLVALVDAYGRAGEGVRTPLPVDRQRGPARPPGPAVGVDQRREPLPGQGTGAGADPGQQGGPGQQLQRGVEHEGSAGATLGTPTTEAAQARSRPSGHDSCSA